MRTRSTVSGKRRQAGLSPRLVTICLALATPVASAAPVSDFSEVFQLSIEDLAKVEISSVAKRPQPLSDAAASIFVITREDIRRSSASTIPEILRLAPNLQVARTDSSNYAITARGFNTSTANMLLVLIDGRTVYTPLYSGVFWDVQDTLLEDIERIEVVSGPGGVLWGSNAVNGVINITTRKTSDTQGGMVGLRSGSAESVATGRYGGKLGEHANYRVYAKAVGRDNTVNARDVDIHNDWNKAQMGFRADWQSGGDGLTVQGDAYSGSIAQPVGNDKSIAGGNLLGRWNRALGDGSSLQVQAYYDRTRRDYPGSFAETLTTADIDFKHDIRWGKGHDLVWGGGYRSMTSDVSTSATLTVFQPLRHLALSNVFIQDTMPLGERLQLTLGVKFEHNSYTGLEVQPNVRAAWKLSDNELLWSAISRAVRTPSRVDTELFSPASPPYLIAGGANFHSEKLTAFELGYRAQPSTRVAYSISAFYNDYDELRSLEPPAAGVRSFVVANMKEGRTYGVEMWASYQVNEDWRLNAGLSQLSSRLRLKPGSLDTASISGNDPAHQYSLCSIHNLRPDLELDLTMRAIGSLPNPAVPAYVAVDARLGWVVKKGLELSLVGSNLLDKRHPEFGSAPARSEIPRAVFVKLLWTL